MVLNTRIAVCAILAVVASSTVLRGQPAVKAATIVGAKAAAPAKAAAAAAKPKEQVEADQQSLENLSKGLNTIHNLRALFTKSKAETLQDGAEKFANGAMSEELSNKDSQIWATIENMVGEVQKAKEATKGKSKEEKEKVMQSLEDNLNNKANVLSSVNDDVSKKQQQQDEEYLLGLLLLHKDNWSMEKQLNATEKFMHNSPILQNLFAHHDATKPLAPQLAVMLDAKPKDVVAKVEKKPTEVAPADTKKPVPKKNLAKAASAAAKTMFIQLTDSIMNRDCPYCAAQCVDKCHAAGNPYVQCMTNCADAGKA